MGVKATFFETSAHFQRWLAKNHASRTELIVGFYRVASGRGGLTHRAALDAALAHGWIDGMVRSLGAEAYSIRFSPRAKNSYWSAVNTKRFRELKKLGLVAPAGQRAFDARDPRRTRRYSFERAKNDAFDAATERRLRADRAVAAFFDAQPPGYRTFATHWIMSAKKEETKRKRLEILIGRSARGLRVDPLKPNVP
jgi:uncharacterized protein YdeI (YjbR/CyaY-like superfamily)